MDALSIFGIGKIREVAHSVTASRRTSSARRRRPQSRAERIAVVASRFGLASRGGFYLLLAALVIRLAAEGNSGPQADANGALSTVASNPVGDVAVAAVAVGFLAFGATRLWSAWHDRRSSTWRRTTTGLQGAFYLLLTWIPLSYVLGNHTTGSNQSQHHAAGDLLRLPAGRELVALLGVIAVGVCANQIRTALTEEYAEGMQTGRAPQWVGWLVRVAALVGIPARAMVFLPIGVCLVIAAVQADPAHAQGLDQLLAKLSGHWWGVVLLVLVALGLLVFATYSFLEARYRKVLRAQ